MSEAWLEHASAWHDFYVIVGRAAVGLTGLIFVVVARGPNMIATRGAAGVRAFVTPVDAVTHFVERN